MLPKVLSFATEAELFALLYNIKDACPLQTALNKMGHPQPPRALITNSSTPLLALPTTLSNNVAVKPLTLTFTGFTIAFVKVRSLSNGRKGNES
jgi:hypothetical protein